MKRLVFLLAAAGAACATARPAKLDGGRIEGAVYRNDYFRFSLPIPAAAVVESSAQTGKLFDDALASTAPVSGALPLLALRLRSTLPNSGDASVISCAIERLPPGAAVKTASDYLDASKAALESQHVPFSVKTPPHAVAVGGEPFSAERFEVRNGGGVLQSELAVSLRRGYAFVVSVTFESDEGFRRAQDVLRSATFR